MSKKQKYYAVVKGRQTGVFITWSGDNGAQQQIAGFKGAVYKSFLTFEEANAFIALHEVENVGLVEPQPPYTQSGEVVIYTDGGAQTNPGPGGYGIVLLSGKHRKELYQGFKMTTNNRMELLACIEALKALTRACQVTIYSDSKYVVDSMTKGWIVNWRKNGWLTSAKKPVENIDLWKQLLAQLENHRVRFQWVKGHAGNYFNDICDQLATKAYSQSHLLEDTAYMMKCSK